MPYTANKPKSHAMVPAEVPGTKKTSIDLATIAAIRTEIQNTFQAILNKEFLLHPTVEQDKIDKIKAEFIEAMYKASAKFATATITSSVFVLEHTSICEKASVALKKLDTPSKIFSDDAVNIDKDNKRKLTTFTIHTLALSVIALSLHFLNIYPVTSLAQATVLGAVSVVFYAVGNVASSMLRRTTPQRSTTASRKIESGDSEAHILKGGVNDSTLTHQAQETAITEQKRCDERKGGSFIENDAIEPASEHSKASSVFDSGEGVFNAFERQREKDNALKARRDATELLNQNRSNTHRASI